MSNTPNYIDLDALLSEDTFSFKYKGVTHHLVETTVDAFIANTDLLQKLSTDGSSLKDEIDVLKKMIVRAFPSLKAEDIGGMTLKQMNHLVDFSRKFGGEGDFNKKVEESSENPPPPAS